MFTLIIVCNYVQWVFFPDIQRNFHTDVSYLLILFLFTCFTLLNLFSILKILIG